MGGGHGTGLLLLIFFLRWGGVGKFGFQNRLGNSPESVGNLIRRGNEPTTIEEYKSRFYKVGGRIGGHVALFGLEYTLFSIISLEIGEDTSRIPLGDYRGNIINSIPPSGRLCLFASV